MPTTPPKRTSPSPARSDKSTSSVKSIKSDKSASSILSIQSDISTLSDDSFKNKYPDLDESLVTILNDHKYFLTRKVLSHVAKKPNDKRVDKNVGFETGGASAQMIADYEAYKKQVDTIKPAMKACQDMRKSIRGPPDEAHLAVRKSCITLADTWCKQAVK